jgi:hypothetical protein
MSLRPVLLTDNAGFELFCDLVYADWLMQSGTCSKIKFHGKRLPWFVSDVTAKDVRPLFLSLFHTTRDGADAL